MLFVSPGNRLDWLLALLMEGACYRDPNPSRSNVNGLEHALQAATRAERIGASRAEVVTALVHDAARPLSDVNHGTAIAEIMRDVLPVKCIEALRHHSEFQSDILRGTVGSDRHAARWWYPTAMLLANLDARSFEPSYESRSLSHFVPMLEQTFRAAA